MAKAALKNIKVLDLTHYIAGPYCTKLMAGFGAEVLKVERPGTGDPMRSIGPFCSGDDHREKSLPFLWLNTGKKSICLDLKTPSGQEKIKQLVKDADVLVENFSPRFLGGLGLSYTTLKEINPRLVMTSISNFGQTGPYRDYKAEEITFYALSGQMFLTGRPDRPPLAPGPSCGQYMAGMHAYIGTLLALYQRDRTGEGQHVDVSIHESSIETIEMPPLINCLHTGMVAKRAKHVMVPWDIYPCQDGYAAVIGAPFRNWTSGAEMFQNKRLFDEEFHHCRDRMQHREEIESYITPWLSTQKKKDVFLAGQKKNLAFGYVATFKEVLSLEPHISRNFFKEIDHPEAGKFRYCDAPFKMEKTPWSVDCAPLLGAHEQEYAEGFIKTRVEKPKSSSCKKKPDDQDLPLQGVRIIDLTHSWAGPHSTRVLADFGAELIRIEYVKRLCPLRGGKTEDKLYEKHPMWFQVNRNKRSVTLDFSLEKEREILRDLIKGADVVVENSRTGVMSRHGFSYTDYTAINPEILVLSMPAFGCSGPYAAFAGYGATIEAISGIQNLTAYQDGEKPFRIKEMDISTGVSAACAVLTGLFHKQQTGEGQQIDFSQLEAITHSNIGEHLLEYVVNGVQKKPQGNRHERYAPRGCYKCRGEDNWLTLSIGSQEEWQRFCQAAGHPEWLSDSLFLNHELRRKNHDELDLLIEEWTVQHDHYELMELLQGVKVAAAAVFDVGQLCADPHLHDREYFVTSSGDNSGKKYPGMPFKLSKGAGTIRWKGPSLGRDNDYVLTEILGRKANEINSFNEDEIGTAFDPE